VYPVSTPNSELDPQRSRALLEMADVVARSRDAAEALVESEQLLTTYFSASKVGFCILDTDFRYLAINHPMAEMNGFPAEAHLGKSVRETGRLCRTHRADVQARVGNSATHFEPRDLFHTAHQDRARPLDRALYSHQGLDREG